MNGNRGNSIVYELCINENQCTFSASIHDALEEARSEKEAILYLLSENLNTLKKLTPECDKLDYTLAVCSGAICGILDIFLVGKPGKSAFENVSDKWFAERTEDFARLYGWDGKGGLSSAIRKLEKTFKIPYDQNGIGDIASSFLDLTPTNHHFKSLAHNPSILGLFFSILNQFTNSSHLVTNGDLVILSDPEGRFELYGNSVPSKLFSAFVNWIGHLISDMSGSSSSKGRGMGIPSPMWAWTNDIIAIKRSLKIPVSEFDKTVNEFALELYTKGYDARFQSTQAIPVFINEMVVRLLYSVRRLVKYFSTYEPAERSFKKCWEVCEPFTNATVKRMLTVAHGTFCMIDTGDALINGFVKGAGSFNVNECFMNLNIVGVGRFAVSLYGEMNRAASSHRIKGDIALLNKEITIVDYYIDGLEILSKAYDDKDLITFTDDFKNSDCYKAAFQKSVELARLRGVPESRIVKNKSEIDKYFMGGKDG